MYIKEINIKTFGGIEDKTYNFSDGLNVLFGANESGKIDCYRVYKIHFFTEFLAKSEFKRYVPLSGEPMCGSITVCGDNCEYEIFRTSKGAKAKANFGCEQGKRRGYERRFCPVMSAKICFRSARMLFEHAVCVKHFKQKFRAATARISARLSNLAQSGDENTSQEKNRIDEDILNLSSPKRKKRGYPDA
ncbi:MAG: ATP-binding protein [Clostridiales bacterium]|nr:MAG: ATP-binding protein [Clostridiales bacterium]